MSMGTLSGAASYFLSMDDNQNLCNQPVNSCSRSITSNSYTFTLKFYRIWVLAPNVVTKVTVYDNLHTITLNVRIDSTFPLNGLAYNYQAFNYMSWVRVTIDLYGDGSNIQSQTVNLNWQLQLY